LRSSDLCLLVAPALYSHSTGPPTPAIYALSLHDALPIYQNSQDTGLLYVWGGGLNNQFVHNYIHDSNIYYSFGHGIYSDDDTDRSEEHTSELQSRENLVCRLLLEKKKMLRRLSVEYLLII